MAPLLLLAFLVVPVVEIYVIIQVGHAIGALPTVVLLLVDGVVGAAIIRREGAKAWLALRRAVGAGRVPTREIADGASVVVGGALLLSPGFVTDVVGLFLVLPWTRPFARRLLAATLGRRVRLLAGLAGGTGARRAGGGAGGERGSRSGEVIEGEVVDEPDGDATHHRPDQIGRAG